MSTLTKLLGLDGNEGYVTGLQELFINELKDIYWAEQELVESLEKLIGAATTAELAKAFDKHLEETKTHVARLAKVFEIVGEEPATKKCEAMAGLVEETEDLINDTDKDTLVRDVALISAAQKVEHYEIATYGILSTLAGVLGYDEAAELLNQTLQEEKNADAKLTQIATNGINWGARFEA